MNFLHKKKGLMLASDIQQSVRHKFLKACFTISMCILLLKLLMGQFIKSNDYQRQTGDRQHYYQ